MTTRTWMSSLVAVVAGLFLMGCDSGDDHHDYHYEYGLGALIVENHTSMDFDIYLDGQYEGDVDDNDDATFDIEPGELHLFLREQYGDRNGVSADVDILEDHLTIVRIYRDTWDWNDYNVTVEYD